MNFCLVTENSVFVPSIIVPRRHILSRDGVLFSFSLLMFKNTGRCLEQFYRNQKVFFFFFQGSSSSIQRYDSFCVLVTPSCHSEPFNDLGVKFSI